jgi:hypothetical protein
VEDPGDALDGLPTKLPASVPALPGAFTSATINAKVDAAVAGFQGSNGFSLGVRVVDQQGEVQIKAALAVKISEGWAVYGEGAMDLHGNKSAEVGIRGKW